MKKTIIITAVTTFIVTVMLISFGVYWAFFDMSRLPEGTLINELESPDGTYTVKAYHVEGGTTVSDSVRGELVFNNSSKRSKNIYWNYREDSAVIKWIDDDKVVINGIGLTVPNSKYDFRNHCLAREVFA